MRHRAVFAAAVLAATPFSASAVVLYGPTGPTPALMTAAPWNWAYGELPGGANVPVSSSANGTKIDTLAAIAAPINSAKAGFNASNSLPFTNALVPAMTHSATSGYTLRFNVGITAETHNDRNDIGDLTDDDRAGFSIIALSSDLKGIELGFFTDRIFSQNANFVGRGEQVAKNTIPFTTYDLAIFDNAYTLSSGGIDLMTGPLRDYSPNNPVLGPYVIPNYLFLGDDTTSAAATAEIGTIELTAVPEPATLGVLAFAAGAMILRRRK